VSSQIAKKKKDFSLFYLSARPYRSVRMEKLGSLWKDFLENCYLSFFENLSRKFKLY